MQFSHLGRASIYCHVAPILGIAFFLSTTPVAEAKEGNSWVDTKGRVKRVLIYAHGLNVKPEKFHPFAEQLALRGAQGYVMRVTGEHKSDGLRRRANVNRDRLLKDFEHGYREASSEAARLGVPIGLVGMSRGALLGEDAANHFPDVKFDRAFHLVPAFEPRMQTLVHYASRFRWLPIPGLTPRSYRMRRIVPAAEYAAVLQSVDALRESRFAASNRPTVFFAEPRDKMISFPLTSTIPEKYQLDQWQMKTLDPHRKQQIGVPWRTVHHMAIDLNSLGEPEWERILDSATRHFGLADPSNN